MGKKKNKTEETVWGKECQFCKMVFPDHRTAWKHVNLCHKIHVCRFCGHTFTSVEKLKKHRRTHMFVT